MPRHEAQGTQDLVVELERVTRQRRHQPAPGPPVRRPESLRRRIDGLLEHGRRTVVERMRHRERRKGPLHVERELAEER